MKNMPRCLIKNTDETNSFDLDKDKFAPRGSVDVLSNWDANGGIIHIVSNQFDNTPVPEPTTIALMGLVWVCLALQFHARKKPALAQCPHN